jgi:hypothetical protein
LTARLGYVFADSPISGSDALFNVASPLIIEHEICFGATFRCARNIELIAAYVHGFQSDISGPFQSPAGPVAGTQVTSIVSSNILSTGITVKY